MTTKNLLFRPATELAQKIRNREITATALLEAHLSQITRHNQTLNAIVTLDEAGARQRAAAADAALARNEIWGPLHGVPITIKDHFATAGLRTTSSHPKLAQFIPPEDATIVQRVRRAGAIILGKTNLPYLGLDIQTDSPIFGRANNPWDVSRTPGGSTGGGAAAVAAGLSPMELGSDLGGSLRIPAHFCGLCSLKPTEGAVSGYGLNPGVRFRRFNSVRHMSVFGPMARSVADLRLLLQIISGADPRAVRVPPRVLPQPAARPLNQVRVAWTDNFDIPVSDDSRRVMRQFVKQLAAQGCQVVRVNPPHFDFATVWRTFGKLFAMEVGVYQPAWWRLFAHLVGGPLRRGIPIAQSVYPITYEKYMLTLTERDALISQLEQFLIPWDVWLCPVTATPAFSHRRPIQLGPQPLYLKPVTVAGERLSYWMANMGFTTVFSLTGHPVVTLPIGLTDSGLPVGMQVVGPRWQEMALLAHAEALEVVAGGFRTPPGFG